MLTLFNDFIHKVEKKQINRSIKTLMRRQKQMLKSKKKKHDAVKKMQTYSK